MEAKKALDILRERILPCCSGNWKSAVEAAIFAVEKQVPKRLRLTISTKRCPSCKKQITSKGAIHSNYRYCRWCGQAIDWTEDDNG